jgi:hypothetical protein
LATEDAAALGATFTIQPNPSNTEFTMLLNEINDTYTVQMTDLVGRVLYESAPSRDAIQHISTAELPNGTYIATLRFRNSALRSIAKKIAVVHE